MYPATNKHKQIVFKIDVALFQLIFDFLLLLTSLENTFWNFFQPTHGKDTSEIFFRKTPMRFVGAVNFAPHTPYKKCHLSPA